MILAPLVIPQSSQSYPGPLDSAGDQAQRFEPLHDLIGRGSTSGFFRGGDDGFGLDRLTGLENGPTDNGELGLVTRAGGLDVVAEVLEQFINECLYSSNKDSRI